MLEKLNQREKFLVAVALILVFSIFIFIAFRLIKKKKEEIIEETLRLQNELQILQRLKENIASIPKVSDIPDKNQFLNLVSQKLQEMQLTPNNIRDREEKIGKGNSKMILIDLSFNSIPLPKLFQFLYEIEYNQKGIKVREILIRKPLPGRDIFDVRLSIYVQKND